MSLIGLWYYDLRSTRRGALCANVDAVGAQKPARRLAALSSLLITLASVGCSQPALGRPERRVDAGVTIKPLTCSDIVPSIPGVALHPIPSVSDGFFLAMSDGAGHALVGYQASCGPWGGCSYVDDIDSICLGCDGGVQTIQRTGSTDNEEVEFYATENGFIKHSIVTYSHDEFLDYYDEDAGGGPMSGRVQLRSSRDDNVTYVAANPTGGVYAATLNQYHGGNLMLQAFNPALVETGSKQLSATGFGVSGLGTNIGGDLFIVWANQGETTWTGEWFDATLKQVAVSVPIAPVPGATGTRVQPLADGSVVYIVRTDPSSPPVATRYSEGGALPLPEWFSKYVATPLTLVRGNRAYAALAQPACSGGAELIAADGQSCGCIFDHQALVSVGIDGSVFVQTSYRDGLWYPALLR